MRLAVCFWVLLLVGCTQPKRYPGLCEIPDEYRDDIGAEVTFPAMYVNGGTEWPPRLVDQRCWTAIRVDTQDAPEVLRKALDRPGNYNKFAVVSGRIDRFNGDPWLHVTTASQVRVLPPMSEAQEGAFITRIISERRAWGVAHRVTH
jgi:hypothetical protein